MTCDHREHHVLEAFCRRKDEMDEYGRQVEAKV
jgi:hypothetical protein